MSWTPFFFLLLVAGGWLLMWLIVAHVSGWPGASVVAPIRTDSICTRIRSFESDALPS